MCKQPSVQPVPVGLGYCMCTNRRAKHWDTAGVQTAFSLSSPSPRWCSRSGGQATLTALGKSIYSDSRCWKPLIHKTVLWGKKQFFCFCKRVIQVSVLLINRRFSCNSTAVSGYAEFRNHNHWIGSNNSNQCQRSLKPVQTCLTALERDKAYFFRHIMECGVSSSISSNQHR